MSLHKTEKARAELRPGQRSLAQRERTLLLLADGTKSAQDFRGLFDGEGEKLAIKLVAEGYLEIRSPGTQSRLTDKATERAQPPVLTPMQAVGREAPAIETTQPVRVVADQFDGKRSLATTRMFLFDICERMFARRDPASAERFRESLRQARDRDTMLIAARAMLDEVERVAGSERADSLSERIAMLLPPELVA